MVYVKIFLLFHVKYFKRLIDNCLAFIVISDGL